MNHNISNFRISRNLQLPDQTRIIRYARAPELGPRILFFTGGTALKKLSKKIINYTHNSIHLISPLDSGGSSAVLREAFQMVSVGDIRNRLMALADQSVQGNPAIYQLFAYRLPGDQSQEELLLVIREMMEGKNDMIRAIPDPMRKIIKNHLRYFWMNITDDASLHTDFFNLKGASIGNIILTGGYLNNERHIDPVIFLFSKLVEVRGTVRPVLNDYLHLCARLENGNLVIGQHNLTGKETAPVSSPVKEIFMTDNREFPVPVHRNIRNKIKDLILNAELIVYPMGSFYSSVLAVFLTKGIGDAVAANQNPKIYIPNTGHDPEQLDMSVYDNILRLLEYLRKSTVGSSDATELPVSSYINFIIIDSKHGDYGSPVNISDIEKLGIQVIDTELVTEKSKPLLDEDKLISILLSFV